MTQASRPGRMYGRGPRTDEYPQRPSGGASSGAEPSRRPRRSRRRGFALITLLVALVSAGVVTTYVLAGLPSASGANRPEQAIEGFLAAIYDTHDPREAGQFVCESARDDAELDRIVLRVSQQAEAYPGSQTTWTYPEIRTEGRAAAADVTLTLTTANDQVATRVVTLLLVDDGGGWRVCDVRTP